MFVFELHSRISRFLHLVMLSSCEKAAQHMLEMLELQADLLQVAQWCNNLHIYMYGVVDSSPVYLGIDANREDQ